MLYLLSHPVSKHLTKQFNKWQEARDRQHMETEKGRTSRLTCCSYSVPWLVPRAASSSAGTGRAWKLEKNKSWKHICGWSQACTVERAKTLALPIPGHVTFNSFPWACSFLSVGRVILCHFCKIVLRMSDLVDKALYQVPSWRQMLLNGTCSLWVVFEYVTEWFLSGVTRSDIRGN